jgi:hypothetical protein
MNGLLLVDDRDGRILAEVKTPDEAQSVIESLWGNETVPDYLCIVEIHSHHGAIVGTDASIKVRPLS